MILVYGIVPNARTLYAKSSQRLKKKDYTQFLLFLYINDWWLLFTPVPVVVIALLPYGCQNGWDMPYVHTHLEVVFALLCAMTVKRVWNLVFDKTKK